MSVRYLNLPSCLYCKKELQCVIEEDVVKNCTCYTVRCNCKAITTTVAKTAIEQGGEGYAVDMAWQRWKEAVNKSMMHTKENPDSEETGAMDSDAVWDAVLRAMIDCYELGGEDKQHDYCKRYRPARTDAFFETLLKEKLNGL